MKNFTVSLILMILSSSILFAQSNSDIAPNINKNPKAIIFTDDLFDHQFDFPCGDGSGEAGIETNGDYIYTSKWNGSGFFCYEMDGTFLGGFNVAGTSSVRDMAYDGNYFYGAAANTSLFEMDFVGVSGTLISTLTAAVATRACAYDAEFDGFWGNNWSDPITLYDRSGNIIRQFDCGAYSSYYGFAMIYPTCAEPLLYGFAQEGGLSQVIIVQIDPETGDETGVTFDAIGYSSTGTGIAGGLASYDTYAPGWWTILGLIQNETIFGVEGGVAGPAPCDDLKLTGIFEPNTGFDLGVEDIVIGVKNSGAITQSNFDVQYRVDGGAYVTETIVESLTYGESITYTFNQPYDFSVFGEYFIEAEVLLPGDEYPPNNYADKTIENYDPYGWCEYSITMWDNYGDGWNGGYVQIFGDGVEYINATLASGAGPETIEFFVEDDAFLTAIFTPGGWAYECSYIVYDPFGNPVFEDGIGGDEPIGGDIGYASCEPPPPIDAGVTEIISPAAGILGIEDVIINVKNFGSEELSEIPVGFKLNDEAWVNEIIPGPIGPDEEIEYTFTATVNLYGLVNIYFETCTFVPDDTISYNDCIIKMFAGPCYCWAMTVNEDEFIANVSMGAIDNSSGWQGSIADYTDLFANVDIGVPEEIIVTNGNPKILDEVTVWVDWNYDFMFNNEVGSNEKFVLMNDGTGAVFTGDIIAPEGTIPGNHRMRIRMAYNEDPYPCDESSFGEVEEYTIVVGLPEPHFVFEGGDPANPIWTIYIGGATVPDTDADMEAGDEIAIFDGDIMVGAFILDQVCTMENVFDNDLTAFSVLNTQAGYQTGNEFTFKCWDASEQEEYDMFMYEFFDPYGDAYMGNVFPTGDGEYSIGALDFVFFPYSHNLSYGYQFISSNVNPLIPDMTVVMAEVLNDNLDFVRNSLGQTLRKIGPNWINGIGDWIVEEGYLVKMFAPDSFSILGAPVNPTTPIPVITGFQFVSYFPFIPMDALLAFETIIGDDLDFVRNSQGQTLRKIGPNWVNGIGDCNRTEGYLVKMFASGEIIYPVSAKSSSRIIIPPANFIFEGGNPAEAVYTLYIDGLEIGDEVAAYDGDKMVGAMKINSQNVFENELPVFSTLINGQGYEEGNPITLKVWSENDNVSADFTMDAIYDSYVSDVYPEGDGKYSIVNIAKGEIENSEEIISIYPNPSEGIFNISIEGVSGNIQVKVFDIHGNDYRLFEIEETKNITTKQLDLKELAAGVYFISFSGKEFSQVKKIVLK